MYTEYKMQMFQLDTIYNAYLPDHQHLRHASRESNQINRNTAFQKSMLR
jgi:hypothetical protein